MAVPLNILPVDTPALLDRFIRLPTRLHRHDPHFVAPLMLERREALSAKTNPFFQHAQVQLWIAQRGGVDVGRISAQIDALAPWTADGVGHFGLIAAEDDAAVLEALFGTAEAWLRERGCTHVMGPFNLSINEETGLLIDGHDHPPMLMMGHDQPYLAPMIEARGYRKAQDLLAYLCEVRQDVPDAARQRMQRSIPENLRVRPLDMRRYREEIGTITAIFNDAWAGNWGFAPFTDAEIDHLARSMKPILDPELVVIAEADGEAVGFGVCLPNLNEAIAGFDGKLLPLNWARLLWRLKLSGLKSARVPLMGVRRSYANRFVRSLVPFVMVDAMRGNALKKGIEQVEFSWILENNTPMRHICEAVGAIPYKTYRVYEKSLA